MNSAPTGCDSACEFHACTRGAGVSRNCLALTFKYVSNLGRLVTKHCDETYEIHRCNFTGSGKVRNPGILVWHFGYDFLAVVYGHMECFVEHAIRALLDIDALSSSDGICCDLREPIQVESDFSLSKILRLIHNKTATCKIEEVFIGIPI